MILWGVDNLGNLDHLDHLGELEGLEELEELAERVAHLGWIREMSPTLWGTQPI